MWQSKKFLVVDKRTPLEKARDELSRINLTLEQLTKRKGELVKKMAEMEAVK